MSHRVCEHCDGYVVENIEHIIMQCPFIEPQREVLLNELSTLHPIVDTKLKENPFRNLVWMLGGNIDNGRAINNIYKQVVNSRNVFG